MRGGSIEPKPFSVSLDISFVGKYRTQEEEDSSKHLHIVEVDHQS